MLRQNIQHVSRLFRHIPPPTPKAALLIDRLYPFTQVAAFDAVLLGVLPLVSKTRICSVSPLHPQFWFIVDIPKVHLVRLSVSEQVGAPPLDYLVVHNL